MPLEKPNYVTLQTKHKINNGTVYWYFIRLADPNLPGNFFFNITCAPTHSQLD